MSKQDVLLYGIISLPLVLKKLCTSYTVMSIWCKDTDCYKMFPEVTLNLEGNYHQCANTIEKLAIAKPTPPVRSKHAPALCCFPCNHCLSKVEGTTKLVMGADAWGCQASLQVQVTCFSIWFSGHSDRKIHYHTLLKMLGESSCDRNQNLDLRHIATRAWTTLV